MRKEKLKYCPFCGATGKDEGKAGKLEILIIEDKLNATREAVIECGNCGVSFNFGHFGNGLSEKRVKQIVIDEFNQRY